VEIPHGRGDFHVPGVNTESIHVGFSRAFAKILGEPPPSSFFWVSDSAFLSAPGRKRPVLYPQYQFFITFFNHRIGDLFLYEREYCFIVKES
jgi:hypothetical protein